VTGISTAEPNSVWRRHLGQVLRNSSGSLAVFVAIRRASSLVSNLAADLPGLFFVIDIRELLLAVVQYTKQGVSLLDGPRRRKAGGRHCHNDGEFNAASSTSAHSRCTFWSLQLLSNWWFGCQIIEARASQMPSWTRLRFEMEEGLHVGG
jgi:hypothetical protein